MRSQRALRIARPSPAVSSRDDSDGSRVPARRGFSVSALAAAIKHEPKPVAIGLAGVGSGVGQTAAPIAPSAGRYYLPPEKQAL